LEADWEVEIGGGAPVIEARWLGFVDLQRFPLRVRQLVEIRQLPGLADALKRLNGRNSSVWTSKCDVFGDVGRDEFDRDELDAPLGDDRYAMALYIDLLPKSEEPWPSREKAVAACKRICSRLQDVGLRCCRLDMVVRRAFISADAGGFAVTAYLTACGRSAAQAKAVLSLAIDAFTDAVAPASTPEKSAQKLQ
jgi:hypothetical protein